MKFNGNTGITWSVLDLTGLLEDEDSHVHFERVQKHLGLHPLHLTNLHVAINEILSAKLNIYDSDLKGFPLAYKNPKLLTPLGEVFYDTCFIHVDIQADFYTFKPTIGCSVKGIVNKKGFSHIGVLVHKAFNVSIPKPEGVEEWPGDNVDIGQEVRFEITHLDLSTRLPFIRGALDESNYLYSCKLPSRVNDTEIDAETSEECSQESPENNRVSFINRIQNEDTSSDSDTQHSQLEEAEQIESNAVSKKHSRKRKHSVEESVTDVKRKKEKKKFKRSNNTDIEDESHVEKDDVFSQQEESIDRDNNVGVKQKSKKALKKNKRKSMLSESDAGNDDVLVKTEEPLTDGDVTEKKIQSKKHVRDKQNTVTLNDKSDAIQTCKSAPKKHSKKLEEIDFNFESDVHIKPEESSLLNSVNCSAETDDESRVKNKRSITHNHGVDTDATDTKEKIQKKSKKRSRKFSTPNVELKFEEIDVKTEETRNGTDIQETNNETHKVRKENSKRTKRLQSTTCGIKKTKTASSNQCSLDSEGLSDTEIDDAISKIKKEDSDERGLKCSEEAKSKKLTKKPSKKLRTLDIKSEFSIGEVKTEKCTADKQVENDEQLKSQLVKNDKVDSKVLSSDAEKKASKSASRKCLKGIKKSGTDSDDSVRIKKEKLNSV